jgi:hypothetical protein
VTPWQARFAVVGFLLIGSAIAANLLMFQEAKMATSAIKPKMERSKQPESIARKAPPPEQREAKTPATAAPKPARAATAPPAKARPETRKPVAKSARTPKSRQATAVNR